MILSHQLRSATSALVGCEIRFVLLNRIVNMLYISIHSKDITNNNKNAKKVRQPRKAEKNKILKS